MISKCCEIPISARERKKNEEEEEILPSEAGIEFSSFHLSIAGANDSHPLSGTTGGFSCTCYAPKLLISSLPLKKMREKFAMTLQKGILEIFEKKGGNTRGKLLPPSRPSPRCGWIAIVASTGKEKPPECKYFPNLPFVESSLLNARTEKGRIKSPSGVEGDNQFKS